MSDVTRLSRRGMLRGAAVAGAGLFLSFHVAPRVALAAPGTPPNKKAPDPNAFLHIAPDDSITVELAHSEMGQGIWTTLAMLVCDELGASWSKMKSKHAGAAPAYMHPAFGSIQLTGGSTTTWSEFERYRTVGAMAREMLVASAAEKWNVPPASCAVAEGVITSGAHRASFGELAEAAMKRTPPASVPLKDPSKWTIIGKPTRRMDTPEKITGKAKFGIDVQFPGLRTALVSRAPAFGAKLQSFDASRALAVPGVEKVVQVPSGIAVVAQHYWAAKVGRDALQVVWSAPEGGGVDTVKQLADFRAKAKAKTPGNVAEQKGNVDQALGKARTRLELAYDVPYLAHAPLEPLNCAVKIEAGKAEIWTGTQFQSNDQMLTAKILGIPPEHVTVNTMFLGGGFGRRANFDSDFVVEAVHVARAAGVPVKTVWTREDDLKGGYYRSMFAHHIEVGLDDKGAPVAWKHGIVGQSIMEGTPFGAMIKHGIDESSVEGVTKSPYIEGLANHRITLHSPKTAVPVLWLRSVGNTHTAFAMESAIDELAAAAKKDPLQYRLDLLKDRPRHAAALKVAAEKAGWGKPLPVGHGLGLAVHESFGTIVANVAECSVDKGKIKVHRFTSVVDCGPVVNPLGVEAQVQGSIAYGLSAALMSEITLKEGKVEQSNFHDFKVLRMVDMPEVQVVIQPSKAKMGGIGEPATAPVAPAVANAVFAASGQRLRSLPLRPQKASGSAS